MENFDCQTYLKSGGAYKIVRESFNAKSYLILYYADYDYLIGFV